MSIFLGDQLADVFDQAAKGGATASKEKGTLLVGVDTLPALPSDPGDRNRTSPFAFTGNRFEFRAPGSGQSIAGPMVAINTMMADSLDFIAGQIEAMQSAGDDFNSSVQKVLELIITDHGRVIFNGDGYSAEWQEEASTRGLKNLRTTVDALVELDSADVRSLFAQHDVLSDRELASRHEVYLEQYCLSVGVEARLTLEMGRTIVLPAAMRHQAGMADGLVNLQSLGVPFDSSILDRLSTSVAELTSSLMALESALLEVDALSAVEEATHARDVLLPAMQDVRGASDDLEDMVADDLWPLPTYQEMLHLL